MADAVDTSTGEPTLEEENILADPERDWMLRQLILLAEFGVQQGITLSVSGGIVTGTLIGGEKYMELVMDHTSKVKMLGDPDGNIRKAILSSYEQFSTIYKKPEGAGDDYQRPPRGYIHLKDARYLFEKSTVPSSGGFLWRGKIKDVSGFSIGSFGDSD